MPSFLEIGVPDGEAAMGFYTDLFGWSFDDLGKGNFFAKTPTTGIGIHPDDPDRDPKTNASDASSNVGTLKESDSAFARCRADSLRAQPPCDRSKYSMARSTPRLMKTPSASAVSSPPTWSVPFVKIFRRSRRSVLPSKTRSVWSGVGLR